MVGTTLSLRRPLWTPMAATGPRLKGNHLTAGGFGSEIGRAAEDGEVCESRVFDQLPERLFRPGSADSGEPRLLIQSPFGPIVRDDDLRPHQSATQPNDSRQLQRNGRFLGSEIEEAIHQGHVDGTAW